jgi:hypothetical protein
MFFSVFDPQAFIKILFFTIQYWYTDKRNKALDIMAKNEAFKDFLPFENLLPRRYLRILYQ